MLELASGLFSSGNVQVSCVGGLQNFVYEYCQDGRSYILRLTPSANRSENMVLSELDWILYLTGNGISVSSPIRSKNGRWTEVLPLSEGYLTCTVFEKAPGRTVGYPACLRDNDLYERLGRLTGNCTRCRNRTGPTHNTDQGMTGATTGFCNISTWSPHPKPASMPAMPTWSGRSARCPKTTARTG